MCLFYYSLFYICSQQKRPRKPKLSESHKYYPKFNRRSKNYSMIVATLPDPTVRPPSRYQTGVLQCANGDFSCDLRGKIRIFHCVLMVFGDFVIMVLSHYFNYSMTVLFFLTLFSQVYFYNIYPLNFPLYLVSFLPTKHHFL